jgi:N,N'-diacetylchitobiose transport system permease protein
VSVATRRNRRPPRRWLGSVAANLAALAFLAFMLFPVYWMAITSFKRDQDIVTLSPRFLPWPATVAHFVDAVQKPHFWTYAFNSVVVSSATVVISLLVAFGAGTAVSRFRFRGRKLFLVVVIVVQMVPLTAMIIPLFLVLRDVDMLNRLPGLVATYVVFVLPFTIWTLRSFIDGVPIELEEAAMVDGCSRVQAFRKVLLPLIAPGLVATAIFAFIQAWNQFLFPLVLMQHQDKYPLTVWLVSFSTNRGTDFGGLMAASTLFTLPVVVLFLLVQRRIVSGLTAGAVKG